MKQRIKHLVLVFAAVLGMTSFIAMPVGAINVFDKIHCDDTNKDTSVCKSKDSDSVATLVQTIISILLFAIGSIAVIMIIVGGIRYTLSNGDASQIKSAKDTILYAVIGLIVSLLAYAIVNFVVAQFT
jgi:H+/Cl- antiporter ClcA